MNSASSFSCFHIFLFIQQYGNEFVFIVRYKHLCPDWRKKSKIEPKFKERSGACSHLSQDRGQSGERPLLAGLQPEIPGTEHRPVPRQTRVPGQEAEPGLPHPGLHLLRGGEERWVAETGEVGDVLRPVPGAAGGVVLDGGLAHREEMWSESSCSDFTKAGHHLKYHIVRLQIHYPLNLHYYYNPTHTLSHQTSSEQRC